MTRRDETETVKDFFSAYFHEDWSEEADDSTSVIALYFAQNPAAAASKQLAGAIQSLAAQEISDEALERALFNDFGCYYVPSADQKTAREWLEGIAASLENGAQRVGGR